MASTLVHIPRSLRADMGLLLRTVVDPHDETLTLLWSPCFDRLHALDLWRQAIVRCPEAMVPTVQVLMQVADRFDHLSSHDKQRLRLLVLRHRRRFAGALA